MIKRISRLFGRIKFILFHRLFNDRSLLILEESLKTQYIEKPKLEISISHLNYLMVLVEGVEKYDNITIEKGTVRIRKKTINESNSVEIIVEKIK